MKKLQDLEGYPDRLDIKEVLASNFDRSDIRDWAIDLLAVEAEPWIDYENEATSVFARAIIGSCRPLMEAMATNNAYEGEEDVLLLAIKTHLELSKSLAHLRQISVELGIRDNL